MKKKILGGMVAVAIAAAAAFNVQFNNDEEKGLSAISLANVEALAGDESGSTWVVTIYSYDHWRCDRGGRVCCPDWDC